RAGRALEARAELVVAEEQLQHAAQRLRAHAVARLIDLAPQPVDVLVDGGEEVLDVELRGGEDAKRRGELELPFELPVLLVARHLADGLDDLAALGAVGPLE